MGRELKRKQAKREGKNVREVQKQNADKPLKMKTFIIIIVAMLLCFVLLYLITGLFITKDIKWFSKKESTDSSDAPVISNRILASESLNQVDEIYYVYYYDADEEDSSVSNTIASLQTPVYRVDLGDDFNSNYLGEPSGIVSNIGDLKVSDPTVIKVENGNITKFYSGKEEIKKVSSEE